jgi:hypothetical protein
MESKDVEGSLKCFGSGLERVGLARLGGGGRENVLISKGASE